MHQNDTSTPFFTEPRPRPQTSHIARNKHSLRQQFALEPDIDPANKLRSLKAELKHLQSLHTSMLVRLNDSRKAIDQQYRSSQKRKVQFLNLYEHRRLKMSEKKLLEEKQSEDERVQLDLRERARTMKLNGQIRGLLLRSQLQEGRSQLCTRNKVLKTKTREEVRAKRQQQLEAARKSHSHIKAGEEELQHKMRRIAQVQLSLAKTNYLRRVGQEVGLVQQLDKLLGHVCQQGWCHDCLPEPLFLTQKF